MGLPIWQPKDEHHHSQKQLLQQQQRNQKLASSKQHQASPLPPPRFQAQYRLYRRRRSTTIGSPNTYYLAENEHHRTLHPLATEQTQHDPYFPLQRPYAAENQNLALPPFIADDLLAILTATSATLTSTSIPSSSSFSNNNNMGLIRSYDRAPSSSTSNTLSPSMTDTPPHATTTTAAAAAAASRLADLESRIVLAHHQVSDRLNVLGATMPDSSPPLITTTR
ncbi:hypothetical protein BCR42DRAFT_413204 [Absidia repens]|uniref:Uncharacterized protein n=1 Tax=Absidia repens TaxID=90262 RepID=A0A1X2IKS3_9FUNG|nr:hypothetical protein BCR42DRAFT_413204 [Absidia repens]